METKIGNATWTYFVNELYILDYQNILDQALFWAEL